MRKERQSGFSLIELMVAVAVMTVAMAGVGAWFSSYRTKMASENIQAELQSQLRSAMDVVGFSLRNAGYGVPQQPASWINWPSTNYVIIVPQTAGTPATLSVLGCTTAPVGYIRENTNSGSKVLTIGSTDEFEMDADRIFMVGDQEHVRGRRIDLDKLEITTDPTGLTGIGLFNGYGPGTQICRLDPFVYEVNTQKAMLTRRRPDEVDALPVMEGIVNMGVTSAVGTNGLLTFTVTLTARSSSPDPLSGHIVQRTMTSQFTKRN